MHRKTATTTTANRRTPKALFLVEWQSCFVHTLFSWYGIVDQLKFNIYHTLAGMHSSEVVRRGDIASPLFLATKHWNQFLKNSGWTISKWSVDLIRKYWMACNLLTRSAWPIESCTDRISSNPFFCVSDNLMNSIIIIYAVSLSSFRQKKIITEIIKLRYSSKVMRKFLVNLSLKSSMSNVEQNFILQLIKWPNMFQFCIHRQCSIFVRMESNDSSHWNAQ